MTDRARAIVVLTLVAAVSWHGMSVSNAVGTRGPIGRELATPYYAAKAARAGGDPYDRVLLAKMAQADHAHDRSTVAPLRTPPPSLALGLWATAMPLERAWHVMIAVQEMALAAMLVWLARWWRPLGVAAPTLAVALLAVLAAVPSALEAARGHLVALCLAVAAGCLDADGRRAVAGSLLGLGAALDPRLAAVALPWVAQSRWRAVLAGAVGFLGAHVAVVPLLGLDRVLGYWTRVVPKLLQGDWTGSGIRISAVDNHAVLGAFGVDSQVVPPALAWGQVTVAGVALLGLAALFRRPSLDPLVGTARLGASLLVALLAATYTREADLVLALPALIAAVLAVGWGQLSERWSVPLGAAVAVLVYPTAPITSLVQGILEPGAPALAPAVAELKTVAMGTILAACVVVGRNPR